MSALAVFTREGHDLRTLLVDGDPWFVALDVLTALDLNRSSVVIDVGVISFGCQNNGGTS